MKHHNNTSTFHHARTVPRVCKNVIYVIKCRMIFKWRKVFSNRTLVPPGLNVNFTFIWASQSYRAHVTLRLCFELYLNVTIRVYFSVAFKRIFAFHGFFEMFVTLQCDLEARQPFSFLKYFVDQSFAVKIACSKRSDSGERCEVKKASRSFLLPTAPPLSERLEQARKKRQIIIISNKQNKQWKYWWKYCGTCYVKEIWLTSLLTDG